MFTFSTKNLNPINVWILFRMKARSNSHLKNCSSLLKKIFWIYDAKRLRESLGVRVHCVLTFQAFDAPLRIFRKLFGSYLLWHESLQLRLFANQNLAF